MSEPALTVIVPNYRRPELVDVCLASLREAVARTPEPVQVIVVDDGSQDGSAEHIRQGHPDVELVALDRNRGYPGAINAGFAAARGEWVLTLNNDTTVEPDVLTELLAAARLDPDVGSLAAQQRFADDSGRIYSAGLVLDRLGVNADRLMGEPLTASEREVTEVFGACGGAAVYRRSMVEALGGFDESFRFGLEDADLAWRARMAGWRCLYVPTAVVHHDLGGTVPHGSRYRFLQAGRNRVRLLAKNADTGLLRRYGAQMVLYDLAYIVFALIAHRTLAPVQGRVESLRRWRPIRASGADGRRPLDLPPAQGLAAALRRRAAWRR
jgi:GT2 family glycosyltransferase